MRRPRRPNKPQDLAEALRELKRLRAEVAKAEADAIARRRLEGHVRDGDTKNKSSGTP